MRQAGRYLPEYKILRAKADNFIDFCLTPSLASEATLQPIQRFDIDAAILFADILLLPLALGKDVTFIEGEGPRLDPVRETGDLHALIFDKARLDPVCETIRLVKEKLPQDKALIGFAGAPWTVACYMIEGQGKTGFDLAKQAVASGDLFVDFLLETLVNATKDYLFAQIDAGAEVIQIFDSHAGLVTGEDFNRCVIDPTRRIVSLIKEKYPHIPVIGFPRGATLAGYQEYASETGVDAIGLDQFADIDFALDHLSGKVIQGNLDPELLKAGGPNMETAAWDLANKIRKKHIFNLGHGVLQETPPENVQKVIEIVRSVDGG